MLNLGSGDLEAIGRIFPHLLVGRQAVVVDGRTWPRALGKGQAIHCVAWLDWLEML